MLCEAQTVLAMWLNSSGVVVDGCHCVEVNCRALTRKVKGILLRKIIGVLFVGCEEFDNFEVGLVDCMSSLDTVLPMQRTKKINYHCSLPTQ